MFVAPRSITSENENAKSFTFQNISKKADLKSSGYSILQILETCEMFEVVESVNYDFPNFPEANKTFHAIYFNINPSFYSLKGLFRGLVSLGKPLGVILEYTVEKDQFTLKYYESNSNAVEAYLIKIIEHVCEEIRFKSILNTILENQRKIKAEESLLWQKLFA
ncbi:hypothetical protein [Belliella aquatica]|uniref:Uncharacterized protein n=1 Tax=Belliella aquatica TaxID=1323734 RepID=A0ABQ1MAQ5_9BACT|nr:hypothetical protein [Belliella aquatica]MCH7405553.1 hypothetical protein [Belliella aquatica]GGC35914.1 hypothetical protein GCM10010993_13440 [Belliella aquatica]